MAAWPSAELSTVIRWTVWWVEHFESGLLQALSAPAQQQYILEHPAGEADESDRSGGLSPTDSVTATATAR